MADASSLINTSFGDDPIPNTTLTAKDLDSLGRQIYYQLDERVSFIKPKDRIIALLYFELGNIYLLGNDRIGANQDYIKARNYGYNDFSLLRKRIDISNNKNPTTQNFNWLSLAGILGCALLIFLIFIRFRKQKRRPEKSSRHIN